MIRHIVALDTKRGIAKDGEQPWHLPTDSQYFRDQTKLYSGVVLMGRKTFEVMGAALPDRQNYVLTRDERFTADNVRVVHDLDAFMATHKDVWIIGGANVYEKTIHLADELYITEIDEDFACDQFYPAYDSFIARKSGPLQTENGISFRYKVYVPQKRKQK